MRRRGRIVVQGPGAPAWLMTYADMMSLLLGVFVLLLAFSIINEKKLGQAVGSLQSAFGAAPAGALVFRESGPPQPPAVTIASAARELRWKLQVMGREQEVLIEYDAHGGLRIVLPEQFFFDVASAEVKRESEPVLQCVGELLAGVLDCFVEVRGHTDAHLLAGNAKFRDNFDLSYARAGNIARRIQDYGRLPIERMEIVACGAGQPAATNATEAGRQANRRVEIVVRQPEGSSEVLDVNGKAASAPPGAASGDATAQ